MANGPWSKFLRRPEPKGVERREGSGAGTTRSKSDDKSRSAKAFRAGAMLKAGGATYEEMRDALLRHDDPDILDWAQQKGIPNGERELHNVYDKAWAQGTIVKIGGVEKRLVDLDGLNKRFAMLEALGKASVYVSRHDRMTIQENDLKRRLANEIVLIGSERTRSRSTKARSNSGPATRNVTSTGASPSPARTLPPTRSTCFRGLASRPRKGNASASSPISTR